ncbi:MAG: protein kinase [Eubacterium sp.]|nr:protein kinase [Eubacterium sp.]
MDTVRKELKQIWPGWEVESKIRELPDYALYSISRKDQFGSRVFSTLIVYIMRCSRSEAELAADAIAQMSRFKGNSNIVSFDDYTVTEDRKSGLWKAMIRTEKLFLLDDYIKTNDLSSGDVVHLGKDICQALETFHKFNVVHGNVRADNIFISEMGSFKLGGMKNLRGKTDGETGSTPDLNYMAPEVFRGEQESNLSDIYALGLILYRLLNYGRSPFMPEYPKPVFDPDIRRGISARMEAAEVPLPKTACSPLGKIVQKACSPAAEERYQSAAAFRDDFEAIGKEELNIKIVLPEDNPEFRPDVINIIQRPEASQTQKITSDPKLADTIPAYSRHKETETEKKDKTAGFLSLKKLIVCALIAVVALSWWRIYGIVQNKWKDKGNLPTTDMTAEGTEEATLADTVSDDTIYFADVHESLTLWEEPSNDSKSIAMLKPLTQVALIDNPIDRYVYIEVLDGEFAGYTGYVNIEYLTKKGDPLRMAVDPEKPE